jgi:SOS response regulatory protein OraA/RecX
VETVVADHGRLAELATALLVLEQRLPSPALDDRERDRAWHLLIRRGYEPEIAYEAVRAHERRADGPRQPAV